MAYCSFCKRTHNAGFISTRFAGQDGVSLEAAKWANVFEKFGITCFYFAGEIETTTTKLKETINRSTKIWQNRQFNSRDVIAK